MTKAELIDAIANSDSVPEDISKKAIQLIFDETFEQIKKSCKDDGRFAVPGFGSFTKKERAARDGRNPKTGEVLKIPASTTIGFKPSKEIKSYME